MKDVEKDPGTFFLRARIHEIMSSVKKNSYICCENISSEMFPSESRKKTEE